MTDKLNEIQTAIDNFQMDEARQLLREELQQNPTAETYFLASQAAKTHGQRVAFLEKTLDLDPFHQAAHDELMGIMPHDTAFPTTPEAQPTRKPKAKNMPNYALASIGKRFLALLIDGIILAVVGGVLGGVYGAVFGANMPVSSDFDREYMQAFAQMQMSAMVIGIIVNAIYHVFFMTRTNGQTPGKQALGIRVVKKDGTPITIGDAILRNVIGYWVSGIVLYLGYFWAMFDSEKQGWHDKIAGTVVVDDR